MPIEELQRSCRVNEEDATGVIISKLLAIKAEYPDIPLMRILNNACNPDVNVDTQLHMRTDVEVAEALVRFSRLIDGLTPPEKPPAQPGHIVVSERRVSLGTVYQHILIDAIVRIDAHEDGTSSILHMMDGERRLCWVEESRGELETLLSKAERIR